jgi:hypothetical protein
MGDLIPFTHQTGTHLPDLDTAASGIATMTELEFEVRQFIALIDERRARGWTKVPYYALHRLRLLVGVPEPITEEDPER